MRRPPRVARNTAVVKSGAAARGRMRTVGLVWGIWGAIAPAIVPGSEAECSSHSMCPNDPGTTRANYCDTANNCYHCAWEAATNGIPYWSSCDVTNNGNGDAIVSVEAALRQHTQRILNPPSP